jgi:putative Holliday junction resolvase
MPVLTVLQFASLKKNQQPLMGLDVGEKTIGLSLSDRTWMIATPLQTLHRDKFSKDGPLLLKLIDEHHVCGCVVGLPINMDGSEGPRCQSVRQFAQNLLALADLPIFFWDERLSTVAVTNILLEADLSRKRRAEVVDKLAASYILQGALDRFQYADLTSLEG